MSYIIYNENCLDAMKRLEDNSVDSIVTDPPYGLSFMGKKWDYDVPSTEIWAECLRVLKPGGHLLAFAGTRTQHRMAVRIEDAGFEIRDLVMWHYGQGFPKSKNLSNGFGSALKPATEPITMARKPLDGTLEANYAEHGTGALNIDGCRVGTTRGVPASHSKSASSVGVIGISGKRLASELNPNMGRWPANLIHDGSDEVVGLFPITQTNAGQGQYGDFLEKSCYGDGWQRKVNQKFDKGSAARFFYCSKASKRDRDEGLDGFEAKATAFGNQAQAELKRGNLDHDDGNSGMNKVQMRQNIHPTVKPTDLMRYLCRLVTPPGGVVLDPFTGSGSTGKAAMLEGFSFIGCELSEEYAAIANARIEAAMNKKDDSKPDKQMSLI